MPTTTPTSGGKNASITPTSGGPPTLKNPNPKISSPGTSRFTDEDLSLSRWMFGLIRELNPEHTEPTFEKWADTVRLMRERDGRTPQAIRELFEWVHNDEFWKSNVLCPEKLRSKWDQLEIKRKHSSGKSHTRIKSNAFDHLE